MTKFLKCTVIMLFFSLIAPLAEAQTRATISGYIRDASGASIPNIKASLTEQNTGLKREAISNDEGFYQFLGLTAGKYTLSVEGSGFRGYISSDMILTTDQNLRADVAMQVGPVNEQVSVTDAAVNVDTCRIHWIPSAG